jgi:hypothetical protein
MEKDVRGNDIKIGSTVAYNYGGKVHTGEVISTKIATRNGIQRTYYKILSHICKGTISEVKSWEGLVVI